jgi:hypothetical protein
MCSNLADAVLLDAARVGAEGAERQRERAEALGRVERNLWRGIARRRRRAGVLRPLRQRPHRRHHAPTQNVIRPRPAHPLLDIQPPLDQHVAASPTTHPPHVRSLPPSLISSYNFPGIGLGF